MKKLICILLILAIFLPIYAMADSNASEHKITINGVNVVFTNGKTVLEPIENDGILYVPLESFLKAMNIDYKVESNEYIITTAIAEPTPTPTPKPTATPREKTPYEMLKNTDKVFLDKFLAKIHKFGDPGAVSIIDVQNSKGEYSGGYFVKASATNAFGGKAIRWVYITKDGELWTVDKGAEEEYLAGGNYDIEAINKALAYKLKELGYR